MDLHNRKMTNHPPSPGWEQQEGNKTKRRMKIVKKEERV